MEIIKELGGFSKKVDDLKSFEDCYVRAQYELSEMTKDAKGNVTSREDRAKHLNTAFQALERGLTLPDAKGKKSTEIGNGRAMLAFYYLKENRYPEAIRHGESLAREDVSTPSSANAATYALQAYGQMIARLEMQLDKNTEAFKDEMGKTVDEPTFVNNLKTQQNKMLDFARFVEKFWPRETAGDLARHQEAILLFRQKGTPQEQNDLFLQGIQALEAISPSYPGLTQARHLLALRCLQAKEKQLPPPRGQPAIDWRQHGLEVWASIPELSALTRTRTTRTSKPGDFCAASGTRTRSSSR